MVRDNYQLSPWTIASLQERAQSDGQDIANGSLGSQVHGKPCWLVTVTRRKKAFYISLGKPGGSESLIYRWRMANNSQQFTLCVCVCSHISFRKTAAADKIGQSSTRNSDMRDEQHTTKETIIFGPRSQISFADTNKRTPLSNHSQQHHHHHHHLKAGQAYLEITVRRAGIQLGVTFTHVSPHVAPLSLFFQVLSGLLLPFLVMINIYFTYYLALGYGLRVGGSCLQYPFPYG